MRLLGRTELGDILFSPPSSIPCRKRRDVHDDDDAMLVNAEQRTQAEAILPPFRPILSILSADCVKVSEEQQQLVSRHSVDRRRRRFSGRSASSGYGQEGVELRRPPLSSAFFVTTTILFIIVYL
ncbi:unnamed protein product [Tilletia laevis]|uniref:Uncharacterized protein n=3 Tax=Tilletia TaxID=13289 RepID=A0A8X7SSD1_9BASI|nr:hypothetical protein CF335_g8526 [Tilletia laevis]KAE8238281.1 hypothetical protein A4X06_0g8896 [Tilletia controversa]KAE8240699.1 hypothetical protein A4X03_0g8438 [Tilletia caries]CAD6943813.1 unnamed protein product [Tilletia laevis]